VVVDGTGLQIVLGHPKTFLNTPQLAVGVDDEFGALAGEVGDVSLSAGQGAGLGLQCPVHALYRT
jgi:hypothetical protein